MSDILDLDLLLPEPKQVKLNGKVYEVFPPTVKQILRLQKIGQGIQTGSIVGDEAESQLIEGLSVLMPALKEEENLDLTFDQMVALIAFLQKTAVPETEASKQYPVEKKTDSSEQ